ncbi:hypothetical protein [Sandarakinorhabdus sp.]|uniref:hypothetical protein n=1 Tax=Sandarakinorhabdus sp. TaxID=1916663 RepID=UPI0033416D38
MNEPFDRGDINEASLAATERLRARLMSPPASAARGPRRSLLPWTITAVLLAFSVGIIANPWIEQTVRGRLPFLPPAAETAEAAALAARLQALERRLPATVSAAGQPIVAAERLAATEARVDSSTDQIERDARRIDQLTAQLSEIASRLAVAETRDAALIAAIKGTADRAEAMLTVLLLRRALDAGRPLDGLLPAARRLFTPGNEAAVAALVAVSAQPVSRAGLARELAGLADAGQASARPDWWQALMVRVQSAFSGAEAGSAAAQARQALARGDIDRAAALLRASPATRADPQVRAWLASATRLRAAEAALAELESVAADAVPADAAAALVPAPLAPPATAPPKAR